ncbi:MAG: FAD-dependent oxidoreductase [Candidatus Dormibacteraeota bacterium]|nr:FAD-dependent oxidoreductase [Candidatus Dormibacteraeota bacterium]
MTVLDADVVVVGAGISGLAAAYRLKSHGLKPLVIEQSDHVGGRMRTDRVGGYNIDAGVTILGRRFGRMRALVRELGLEHMTQSVPFSLAIDGSDRTRTYRAARPDGLLLGRNLSLEEKLSVARFGIDMLRYRGVLLHGLADQATQLDDRTAADYLRGLGRGGSSLLRDLFEPGLRAAVGGDLGATSRQVLLTVVFNTLDAGLWNFREAVDLLPRALAAAVDVRLSVEAVAVQRPSTGIVVEVDESGRRQTLRARGAILAIPGGRIPGLAAWLPDWLLGPLARTEFSRLSSIHLGLRRAPAAKVVGVGFINAAAGIGVLELEHLRAPGRTPADKGMVSVYFVNAPGFDCVDSNDAELTRRAMEIVESRFPGLGKEIELVHRVTWPTGIALFPVGRIREMSAVRRRLASWNEPVDVAGDWLDGIASESALRTGEQAADRLAARMSSTVFRG